MNGQIKTMQLMWDTFEKACIPPQAQEHQRRSMKEAFYGGASALLQMVLVATSMNEDEATKRIDALSGELQRLLGNMLDAANARAEADTKRMDHLIANAVGNAMHMGAVLYDPLLVIPRDMNEAEVRPSIDRAIAEGRIT